MNFALLTTLGLLLVVIIARYSTRKVLMIQYPFLVSVVIAGWVFPQLIGIYVTGTVPPDALSKTISYIMLCMMFAVWGYSATRKTYRMATWQYSQQKLQIAAFALMLAGAFFHVRFSALAAEATELHGGFWTGIITVYVFLASMLTVGFVLAIGSFIQKPTMMNQAMIAFGLALYLQRILIYGRREEAVELFLIIALFLWRKYGWIPSRLVLFSAVIVGMLFISAAGAYREVMISTESFGWSGTSLSEILNINFWGIFSSSLIDPEKNQELTNAVLFISAADIRMEFDGGLSLWNRFVFSFIPGQFVGHDIKQSLQVPLPNLTFKEYYHIPWPGTTYTGFADSFGSFWFFGAFVFFAIGSVMRSWFIGAARGSLTALMILMLISVKSLMAVTHNSYDFFLFFVNLTVFLFPALLFARKSSAKHGLTQTIENA
jgi:hypothetical protein